MGFFDSISERYQAWKNERREKKEQKRRASQQQPIVVQQQQQQTPTGSQLNQQPHPPQPQVIHSGSRPSQQVSPASDVDDELFSFDAPPPALPHSPHSFSHGAFLTIPPHIQQQHQLPHHFRSSSPTSIPTHNSQLSTPYHVNHGRVNGYGSPMGLGSSPSSDLHPPHFPSNHTTPQRPFTASSHPVHHESKEEIDFFEDLDAMNLSHRPNPVSSTSAAATSSSGRAQPQTEDERYAELLQQQEYLNFMEESGELTHSDAALLTARAEREVRRAKRREKRRAEAAAAASALGGNGAGGNAVVVDPESPVSPDSPPLDESVSASAAAAFAAFQERAQSVMESHQHAQQRSHRPSSASISSQGAQMSASQQHHMDMYRPHALSFGPPLQLHQSPSSEQLPPLNCLFSPPSRSPSSSVVHSQSHSSLPPIQTARTPNRSASLSRSELNALPVFSYVPSPTSVQAKQAKAASQEEASTTMLTTDETTLVSTTTLTALPTSISSTTTISTTTTHHVQEETNDSCSICLGDYEVAEQLRLLPCLHKYHAKCIDDWLSRSIVCPECQFSVREAL